MNRVFINYTIHNGKEKAKWNYFMTHLWLLILHPLPNWKLKDNLEVVSIQLKLYVMKVNNIFMVVQMLTKDNGLYI